MTRRYIHLFLLCFVCLSISISADGQTLTQYVRQKKQEVAEQQRIEKQKYEQVCQKGTLEAYKEYVRLYPKGKYISEIQSRIDDYELWSKAKKANTVAAYRQYLQKSEHKYFAGQADDAIQELHSVSEWIKVKYSNSISEISSFISKYPKSTHVSSARQRIHELRGVEYYNSGNLRLALDEFDEAGGRTALQASNMAMYEKCKEYGDYSALGYKASESELESFLGNYPDSKYYNEISNRLAIVKAQELTMSSYGYAGNAARSYAKDAATLAIVDRYIDEARQDHSRYKRRQRRMRHKANGRLVQVGFELIDLGFNPTAHNDTNDALGIVWYYNIGVNVKIGNYKDPVQFQIGAKPGIVSYTVAGESEMKFHLPLFAQMKVNLCSLGDGTELFADCTGYYNAVKENYLENDYAISGGIGFGWHHWDWSFFYKVDINNKYKLDNDFVGTSLIYYF